MRRSIMARIRLNMIFLLLLLSGHSVSTSQSGASAEKIIVIIKNSIFKAFLPRYRDKTGVVILFFVLLFVSFFACLSLIKSKSDV